MTIATRGQGAPPDPEESGQSSSPVGSHDQPVQDMNMEDCGIDAEGEDASGEPDFPHDLLATLDDKITSPRWVVPVLPEQELETLMQAAIDLSKKGLDTRSEACQRFFREGLTISFTKILTDDAVNSWKFNIQHCILQNCERLVELCVVKLSDDWFPLLELLAMVFNPNSKFHVFNGAHASDSVPPGSNIPDEQIFARSPSDSRQPRGWLVDLINKFGHLGGFQILLDRFQNGQKLSVTTIYALIRPFGLCHEYLTAHTITKYLMPIVEMVPQILDDLTDDELKKEAKHDTKNDAISAIIKACKCLVSRIPNQEEMIKNLEIFRLKIILRLLQISTFNGKMSALNEVNKVIASVTYYPHRHSGLEEEEWLTAERMARWIKDNHVLEIVLRDSMHQIQYVEKLEKILRFVIKERALTLTDLDNIWAAQNGKHEAIVKNVHDLLAKLAWDFLPEQLDHLFECFQASWKTADKKQREKLLELIRRLAEDDKDGVMAHKVLTLFWNLAHDDDVPNEIMDQALTAHVKILDYSCSQERDAQKTVWLDKCVEELKSSDKWVLPALKQIKEICCLYEPTPTMNHGQRSHHTSYRQEIIERLQQNHMLVILVTNSLTSYMDKARQEAKANVSLDPNNYYPDKRFNHLAQVQERLNFLRFLLKDGQLWLCADQAKQIWQALAEDAVFPSDREACFKWFSKLMGEEPDLDPAINKDFFENNILQLDPTLLTESGMRCFERFFKAVNTKEGKLKAKRRSFMMDDVDLIGTEYLWRVVTNSADEIANRGIELLKDVNTNLGPQLQTQLVKFHESYVSECLCRLRAHYDTITILSSCSGDTDEDPVLASKRLHTEAVKLCRVMKVLQEYISECDNDFNGERKILPLQRSCRGKHLILIVRFSTPGRQSEDVEVFTHSNDTLISLRRQVLRRIKASGVNVKLDLFVNGEILDPAEDHKLLSQVPLRNKAVLTAKLCQSNTNMPSSPDSSSDSSTGSPQHPYDGPNSEAENCLPGVLMSQRPNYVQFFFQVADLGCAIKNAPLRDGARMLLSLVPPDTLTVQRLTALFKNFAVNGVEESVPLGGDLSGQTTSIPPPHLPPPTIEHMFFHSSPSQVLYNLEVMYALLMPALDTASDKGLEFLYNFVKSGVASVILDMLTRPNFLPSADIATKRSAYLTLLKICKLLLTVVVIVVAHILDFSPDKLQAFLEPQNLSTLNNIMSSSQHQKEKVSNEAVDRNTECLHDSEADKDRQYFTLLKQIMHNIPNTTDTMLWTVGVKLGTSIAKQMGSGSQEHSRARPMFVQALTGKLPDLNTIQAVINLAWAASSGSIEMSNAPPDQLHALHEINIDKSLEQDDVLVSKEALEVLSMSLVLNVKILYGLSKDEMWHKFIIDSVLLCKNRSVRLCIVDQILTILTWCNASSQPLQDFIALLFSVLHTTVVENASRSQEYFQLLCRLLNCAYVSNCPLPEAESLLNDEIVWLKKVKDNVKTTGETQVDEAVLEGHLGIAKELLSFMSPEKKYELGSDESKGILLIKELVEDFVFPSSRLMLHLQKTGQLSQDQAIPVCTTPGTLTMAFDFLVALCVECVHNMRLLVEMLSEMFYSERDDPLVEWDYLPPVGPRPSKGFVGLKNAGATCYMNSILQQLYMLENIRVGILGADGAATDLNEDFSGDDRLEVDNNVDQTDSESSDDSKSAEEARKEYNIGILKQVQAIFGHLAYSKLQYYVPKGLWKHFKLQGEPVNLREQQDAVEFFNSLVECVDEALKALNLEQIMIKTLGGSYSDQKICKGCPHRYSREESFSVLSVEIRNHPTLLDSLEQYVKGELLEGGDAYHCDKCDKKVVTVKRLCVKKLPPILAIQLKRFEYDYERVCPIKFNDYFEFPRDLDMEPYTVMGLAKQEGEMIDCDYDEISKDVCTKYQLTGIVVHSGQASGGHYYSYVLNRQADGTAKWYKFDDGEVTECKMEDEEEMKTQCFGGDYMGEVFDHMLKRMSLRRQKRWWNAYMLYYTRLDVEENSLMKSLNELSLSDTKLSIMKMPPAIERSVRKQNIKFMHNRNQFSPEYFHFVRKLVSSNIPSRQQNSDKPNLDSEPLSMLSVQLAARFLFHTGFHTKKTLRGAAMDWFDVLCHHLRAFKSVRSWFATNILFQHPHRFCEYLLACPSAEVRSAFMKIIVFLAHFSLQDGPCRPPNLNAPVVLYKPNTTLSDHLLHAVLHLLDKEVSEHGRNLTHYFSLFQTYASLGIQERTQLLNLDVPVKFMRVALDEGPGPNIKYQCPELTKLHQVVSQLIRCCDVSSKCNSSHPGQALLPNPYAEPSSQDYIMPIRPAEAEYLFSRKPYVKKLIEDANLSEDTVKLLHFCCWENPQFSRTVLSELLWQIASAYCHELHHHMQLLLNMMLMEDSWQIQRINNALKGIPEEQDGLFTTIQRNKSQYQKRSYQCIKCLVVLFSKCEVAMNELKKSAELRRKWDLSVAWLQDELNRRPYAPSTQYSYKNWSPPTHSNESTNGFFLERSNSARMTLDRAVAICPAEDLVPEDLVEDDDTSSPQLSKACPVKSWRKHRPIECYFEDVSNYSYDFNPGRFDFSPVQDVAPRSDASPDVAPIFEVALVSEVGQGSTQATDAAPSAAPDVTSAPNVSPASSVASDIPPDIPSDVTLGLDSNAPDASSSSDAAPETTDVTTESDNSTVIDVDQSVPATSNATPKGFSPATKVPSSIFVVKSEQDEADPDAVLQWQWRVLTSNSTAPTKNSEQSPPPEIIKD